MRSSRWRVIWRRRPSSSTGRRSSRRRQPPRRRVTRLRSCRRPSRPRSGSHRSPPRHPIRTVRMRRPQCRSGSRRLRNRSSVSSRRSVSPAGRCRLSPSSRGIRWVLPYRRLRRGSALRRTAPRVSVPRCRRRDSARLVPRRASAHRSQAGTPARVARSSPVRWGRRRLPSTWLNRCSPRVIRSSSG